MNIEGLDKATVLAALYNAASPKGLGFLHYDATPMTAEQAAAIDPDQYFDYLQGRPLKIDLRQDAIDTDGYNRSHGAGAAEKVIAALRDGAPPDADAFLATATALRTQALTEARSAISKPTTQTKGVIKLGAADLAEPLEKALDLADEESEPDQVRSAPEGDAAIVRLVRSFEAVGEQGRRLSPPPPLPGEKND